MNKTLAEFTSRELFEHLWMMLETAETDAVYWKEKYDGRWAGAGDNDERQILRNLIRESNEKLGQMMGLLTGFAIDYPEYSQHIHDKLDKILSRPELVGEESPFMDQTAPIVSVSRLLDELCACLTLICDLYRGYPEKELAEPIQSLVPRIRKLLKDEGIDDSNDSWDIENQGEHGS
jgi:hypothetical protein